jgi:ATP-binding cassette subfamily B protein
MAGLLDEVQAPTGKLTGRRQLELGRAALRLVLASARKDLVIVAGCAVLLGVCSAAQVLLTGYAVGAVLGGELSTGVMTSLLLLVVITAGMKFISAFQLERERLAGELVARHAQGHVLKVAGGASLSSFDRPEFYDRLQRAMVTAEIRPAQLASGVLGTLSALTASAGVAVGLMVISPLLGGLVLLSAIPLWLATSRANQLLYRFNYRITQVDRERNYLSQVMTSKESASEVRAFGLSGFLRERFEKLYGLRIDGVRVVMRQRLKGTLAGTAANTVAVCAVVVLAGFMATRGWLSLAQAGAAIVAIGLMSQRLTVVAEHALRLHESALFIEDFVSFVEPEHRKLAATTKESAPAPFGRIEVDGVRFRYANSKAEAVRGVSLQINAGEVIAFVGENGSGKTTLAKLIAGLYDPSAGQIRWDGEETTRPESVTLAFQDFSRYELTVAGNIALGRPERFGDLDRTREAARLAGADGFIGSLPEGYETQLGSQFNGGIDLSGGQWQRLALARMFFRDAPLVILDEPTAALDPRAERELFDDIRKLYADRTVILISHRFANVRPADRIYVLSDGEITESGSHQELMALGGHYADLFQIQAAGYQAEWEPHALG